MSAASSSSCVAIARTDRLCFESERVSLCSPFFVSQSANRPEVGAPTRSTSAALWEPRPAANADRRSAHQSHPSQSPIPPRFCRSRALAANAAQGQPNNPSPPLASPIPPRFCRSRDPRRMQTADLPNNPSPPFASPIPPRFCGSRDPRRMQTADLPINPTLRKALTPPRFCRSRDPRRMQTKKALTRPRFCRRRAPAANADRRSAQQSHPSQSPDPTTLQWEPRSLGDAGQRSANNLNLQPSRIPVRIVTDMFYQPGPQRVRNDVSRYRPQIILAT